MTALAVVVLGAMFTVAAGWAAWASSTLVKILTELVGTKYRMTAVEADVGVVKADVIALKTRVHGLESM